MTSPLTIGDFKYAPLYFFDQPKRDRSKCTRNNLLHFDLGNEGTRIATVQSFHACDTDDNVSKELNSEETSHKLRIEATLEGNHEISIHAKGTTNIINERYPLAVTAEGAENKNQIDAYKYVAPHLLSELAVLLSECAGSEDVCVPHGLVNVLNYSWRDLSSDAIYGKRTSELAAGEGVKQSKSKDVPNFDNTPRVMVVDGPKNTKKKDSVVENVGPKQNNIILYTLRRKPSISNTNRANAPTLSFSISSKTCKEQGWILQPNELEEPRWTTLYQWVVERLQMARISIKLQTAKQAEQGLDKPLILRCYGEVTPYVKNRKTPGKAKPVTLCNGLPKIPEIKQEDNSQNKLHWRINDGSSFIYYSSGNIAVCQSHSILPSGGFYTNVFSDNASPVIVASITAFGHGTVTHPVSGMIIAVWDQRGGLICDPNGSVTTKWTWPTAAGLKEKITVQVSDQISVKLVSANTAILCFTALGDSVQLPLSALPNVIHPKETAYLRTEGAFHSLTAGELSLAKRRKPQSQIVERKRALQLKCCQDVLQIFKAVERLEEQSPLWRGGCAARDLKRLQQRIWNIVDEWLELYRMATGIKCPDIERMPNGQSRSRSKGEVQSAMPPTDPGPVLEGSTPGQPEGSSTLLQALPRHLSAPGDSLLGSSSTLSHSLMFPKRIALQPPPAAGFPTSSISGPSSPCPVLLRAALRGEDIRRLCRCSSRTMPLLTDVEYNAFIAGQPPHSEQILVVCVTPQRQPLSPHIHSTEDVLEQLYERRNKNRTMPCTQCQLDSFRLVRYEMSTGRMCSGPHNTLLLQRHNAAPGMFLMYVRGKLLFADFIFNGYSFSVRNLHKQISKTRGDYRQGHSLPPDFKFSSKVKTAAAEDVSIPERSHKIYVGREDSL